jgi:rhodanese-related sulfurtransferase
MPEIPVPSAAVPRAAVLDVRGVSEFARGHLAGSGHIPAAELVERRGELPPRDHPGVVVAATGADAKAAAAVVEELGYEQVTWFDAGVDALPGGLDDTGPATRLWRPSPFLADVVAGIPRGPALDVAAGHGREAVFLAIEGFEVEAWDHAPEALAKARSLAARNGVTITTHEKDLESRSIAIPEGAYALVTCFRFLHRPLLPKMELALAPGGHLVYETFRIGQERFGRPKSPRYLFQDGELARTFPSLEVLRYEEVEAPAAVMARILARRPG